MTDLLPLLDVWLDSRLKASSNRRTLVHSAILAPDTLPPEGSILARQPNARFRLVDLSYDRFKAHGACDSVW